MFGNTLLFYKCFIYIEKFNPHNNPLRCVLLTDNSVLEIKELRHREVKWIIQGHTAKLGWIKMMHTSLIAEPTVSTMLWASRLPGIHFKSR